MSRTGVHMELVQITRQSRCRLTWRLFLAVALISGGWLRTTEADCRQVAQNFSVKEVAPGHWLHVGRHEDMSVENCGDIANTGYIVGEKSVAVIDTGGSRVIAQALKSSISRKTKLPISHMIVTHAHPDHYLGGMEFAQVPEFLVHPGYFDALSLRGQIDEERYRSIDARGWIPHGSQRLAAEEFPLVLDLGNKELRVHALSEGHTDHDLVIEDTTNKILWAGDEIVAQRLPSLEGSLDGWLKNLQRLKMLDIELVIPGHGEPGAPDEMIARQVEYLSWLKHSVTHQIQRNASLFTTQKALGHEHQHEQLDGWLLVELHHPMNIVRAYSEFEWQ